MLNERTYRFLFLLLLMCGSGGIVIADKPNILLLYCDDLRWDTIGVVQREQGTSARWPWLRTPNIDSLAAEGVRFRESFVIHSLCSPGRAAVLTGQYSHRHGVLGNETPMPSDVDNVALRLRANGYHTSYFGKWHFGKQAERPGFDSVASFVGQGHYQDCDFLVDGELTPSDGWVDDVSTDYAIDYLAKSHEKPFFTVLAFKSPHGPRGGKNLPNRLRKMYKGKSTHNVPNGDNPAIYFSEKKKEKIRSGNGPKRTGSIQAHQDYMRHATGVDQNVGRIMQALRDNHLLENTLVIFSSDNGFYLGEHGCNDKRTAYEESIRVPLIMRLPNADQPARGIVNDDLVLNIDYASTILDFAGTTPLESSQGRSLRPLITGDAKSISRTEVWRTEFLYEYFREEKYSDVPSVFALRTKTHKLIRYPGHSEWTELFDLRTDPYETTNLAANPELTELLTSKLNEAKVEMGLK